MNQLKNQLKINIAFVLCGLDYGGAERLVLDLIKNIDREIFNVHLITIKGGGKLLAEFEKTGIQIKLFNKTSKLGLKTIWEIKKYFKQQKIDIVHTHLFAGDIWGGIAACLARVPIIVSTEHNLNLDEGWLRKIFKNFSSVYMRKIFAVSEAVREYLIKLEKINPEKIKVIYNGVDLAKFGFIKDYHFNSSQTTLGLIGRLEPQKGHLVALEALERSIVRYPDLKLIIMGDGSLKPIIEQRIKELDLTDRVIWQATQTDVIPIFRQLDILIVPSLWEGLGIIVLEAMACGLPVITSEVNGLKELIVDGQNGWLFTPSDSLMLAEKIKSLINNQTDLEIIRQNGRKMVEQKFNIKNISQQYQQAYFELYSSR
jgi:glycosyltransferase involved in cell wall biosynthesis